MVYVLGYKCSSLAEHTLCRAHVIKHNAICIHWIPNWTVTMRDLHESALLENSMQGFFFHFLTSQESHTKSTINVLHLWITVIVNLGIFRPMWATSASIFIIEQTITVFTEIAPPLQVYSNLFCRDFVINTGDSVITSPTVSDFALCWMCGVFSSRQSFLLHMRSNWPAYVKMWLHCWSQLQSPVTSGKKERSSFDLAVIAAGH